MSLEALEALLLVWEERHAVAELSFDPLSGWRFRYLDAIRIATKEGFRFVPGLPDPEPNVWKRFEKLIPAMRRALPPLERTDVRKLLGEHATESGESPLYWYLRLTGGKVVGKGLRFVPASEWKGGARGASGVADQAVRNDLRRIVESCREALEADARKQLESRYGIRPDGVAIPTAELKTLAADKARLLERREIEDAIAHHERCGLARDDAYRRFIRETAFTYLNRLAALKMAEHPSRGLLREGVGAGRNSKAFKEFCLVAPGAVRARPDGGYRLFLECLFDELAAEVGALFDRRGAHSLLFPEPSTIDEVLTLLNAPALAAVWADDETLGWIYQYFTPKEQRDKTHKLRGRSGPANSYEMAFLNQFYTPRYVVEFLVRHSLGRLWDELKSGAKPARDPRRIRILDPACGSGHFLIGAFDAMLNIYAEAYDHPEIGRNVRTEYPDRTAYLADVPRLIVAENLFGVDIDLRAAQVASLALFFRAQREWHRQGVKPEARPLIESNHIAVAAPMPGEDDLFEEFLKEDLRQAFLVDLARAIREKLKLAGEAGSLLKIKEELQTKIKAGRDKYSAMVKKSDAALPFEDTRMRPAEELPFNEITDEEFFDRADTEIFQALERFATKAGPDAFRRRIFGRDSAQCVKFLEVIRRPYDVVLMNPPFGRPGQGSRQYINETYTRSANDVFAAFVERGLELIRPEGGYVGAITSRTGFFLGSFQAWREEVLIKENRFRVMADLGSGVLDAMVEVAAYVVEKGRGEERPAEFLRALTVDDKAKALAEIEENAEDARWFREDPAGFSVIASSPFAYWVPGHIRKRLRTETPFEPKVGDVRQGLVTGADDIFVRAVWEGRPEDMILHKSAAGSAMIQPAGQSKWAYFVKSGISQPLFVPLLEVVDWKGDGIALKNFTDERGDLRSRPQNMQFYFRPGFSWVYRAVRYIPYLVPSNSIPTHSRQQAFPHNGFETLALGVVASNIASAYFRMFGEKFAWPKYKIEKLQTFPWPQNTNPFHTELHRVVTTEVAKRRAAYSFFEPFQEFVAPLAIDEAKKPADDLKYDPRSLLGRELEIKVAEAYGFSEKDLEILERDLMEALAMRRRPADPDADSDEDDEDDEDENQTVLQDTPAIRAELLVSYAIGCLFGRWDIRIGKDRTLAPKAAGPFDPLPFYPPGGLVGPDGFPATKETIVSEEWLRARPDTLHLPPQGAVKHPTTDDYPIEIAWNGIIPDDPGDPRDIVQGIRRVLEYLYDDPAAVEERILTALGVKDLRVHLRNPRAFFSAHILRYSALNGKRKAPIYWLIQSRERNYGLWLYYHRLSRNTLYVILHDFLDPRERRVRTALDDARAREEGAPAAKPSRRGKGERSETLAEEAEEIRELKSAIAAVQPDWDPDLDDGSLLNASLLWKVIPSPHVKKTRAAYDAGKFDWSNLAGRLRKGSAK